MTATTSALTAGAPVLVRTAFGDELRRVAASGPVRGHDFMVVLITTEEEWHQAAVDGREAEVTPWPAEDVRPA